MIIAIMLEMREKKGSMKTNNRTDDHMTEYLYECGEYFLKEVMDEGGNLVNESEIEFTG